MSRSARVAAAAITVLGLACGGPTEVEDQALTETEAALLPPPPPPPMQQPPPPPPPPAPPPPAATVQVTTFSTNGMIDPANEFFRSLGTNGRTCDTCHQNATGWTVTPGSIQQRFDATGGLDPIFRANDGANSPTADVSTVEARRAAYSMLLSRGLIRVGLGLPANREFDLVAVDDPHRHASAAELSLFRRPLPSANLRFIGQVMWDGRETVPGDLHQSLSNQANGATVGHAQATQPLNIAQRTSIVGFETALHTAALSRSDAGRLDVCGGRGRAQALVTQALLPGRFDLYDSWNNLPAGACTTVAEDTVRAQIARGQQLFNTLQNGRGQACRTCHDGANTGANTNLRFFDIGTAAGVRRGPGMPLYTLRRRATGETMQTTDPGRGLITGRWGDVGSFKVPVLRGAAARAPYFHNGSAATLADVVRFYATVQQFRLTPAQEADLVAFLGSL